MARHDDTSYPFWVPANTNLAGGYTSAPVLVLGAVGISVNTISSGTVSGTWKLQFTDFGVGDATPQDAPPSAGWVDSTVTPLTASSGAQRLDQATNAKWARLVFTDTGSTGSFQAALTVRKYPGT